MCGICGYIGAVDEHALRQMRDSLAHRGPDEAGEFFGEQVALGHRRLSIVDVLAGQQPFISDDGSVVLVFNGEIYNHPQLRRTLQAKGHRYRTDSDTESLLLAYREYGVDCPQHLDGMFAFVLLDKRKNILFGARDRFGKKPLYYSRPGKDFVFASEIRALLKHPRVARDARVSETSLRAYLVHDYLPGDVSIFENVRKLEAGHAFQIDVGSGGADDLTIWRYWTNPILERSTIKLSTADAASEVIRLLGNAVERRLMSDVPLGAFLSGGIDSTTIVALLANIIPPQEIKTFSIGFEDKSFDESEHALRAAAHFGTDHHSITFSATDCLAELALTSAHLDEPFADPSIVPTSLLSRFARQTVTVALGGDGGDELFAGYDPFAALGAAKLYDAIVPSALHTQVRKLARLLPASPDNMALGFRVERFLRGVKQPPGSRLATWMGPFSEEQLTSLLPQPVDRSSPAFGPETALYQALVGSGADPVQAALAYYQSFYLTDDILVKADRASMMHSLELRSPFLDTDLAEFVNRLPSDQKYRLGRSKALLKQAVSAAGGRLGLVPDAIINRPKKGFGIPVARWIRHELKEEFRAKLIGDWPETLNMISHKQIEALFSAHVEGRENNYKELWSLFILGEWARNWIA